MTILGGPFSFRIQSSLLTSLIYGSSATVPISSIIPRMWVLCSQTVQVNQALSTVKISHFINQLSANLLTSTSSFSYTTSQWPSGQSIYLGQNSTGANENGLGFKNFMFLEYLLSYSEHLYLTHNEQYFKRVSPFYFMMSEGKNPAIINGKQPYRNGVRLSQLSQSDSFVWERDEYLLRLCPDSNFQIFDQFSSLCQTQKVRNVAQGLTQPNSTSYFALPNLFNDVSSTMSDNYQFTISLFVLLNSLPVGSQQAIFTLNPTRQFYCVFMYAVISASSIDVIIGANNEVLTITDLGYQLSTDWTLVGVSRINSQTFQFFIGSKTYNLPIPSTSTYSTNNVFDNILYIGASDYYSSVWELNGYFRNLRIYKSVLTNPFILNFDSIMDRQTLTKVYASYNFDEPTLYYTFMDLKDSSGSKIYRQFIASQTVIVSPTLLLTQKSFDISIEQTPVLIDTSSTPPFTAMISTPNNQWTIDFLFSPVDSSVSLTPLITFRQFVKIRYLASSSSLNMIYLPTLASYQSNTGSFTLQNTFIHIALTYSLPLNQLRLFLNGVIQTIWSIPSTTPLTLFSNQNIAPILDTTTFFRQIRVWTTDFSFNAVRSLYSKQMDYFHHQDILLFLFDPYQNSQRYPYREVYVNQFQFISTDTLLLSDPTNLIPPTFCPFYSSFESNSGTCSNRYYLPLSYQANGDVRLPLPKDSTQGFTNQNNFQDFTIGFWVLYKDSIDIGTFIEFDFGSVTYALKESASQTVFSSASAFANIGKALFKRTDFDATLSFYSSWRYIHMLWQQTSAVSFYLDNTLMAQSNGSPASSGLNLNVNRIYSIVLCPGHACDTILAFVKVWSQLMSFDNQCQYRALFDISNGIISNWPLTYSSIASPQDEFLTDDSYFNLVAHLQTSSIYSKSIWQTMFEIYPKGEDLGICEFDQHFDPASNEGKSQFYGGLIPKIFKSNSGLPLQYTIGNKRNEWSLEFWFSYYINDLKPEYISDPIVLGGHQSGCSSYPQLIIQTGYDLVNSVRTLSTTINNGTMVLPLLQDGQSLIAGTWYHYLLTNDYVQQTVTQEVTFIPTQINGSIVGQLPNCKFQIGDGSNPSAFSNLDQILQNYLKVSEFRLWNSVRTQDEIKFYSLQPMFRKQPNLVAYYKLSYCFDSTSNIITNEIFDTSSYDFIVRDTTGDLFTIDCPAGMTGSKQGGCLSYQIMATSPSPGSQSNTLIQADLGTEIVEQISRSELQLTVILMLRNIKVGVIQTILEIENLFQMKKRSSGDLSFNLQCTGGAITLVDNSYSAEGSYSYSYVTIDQKEQAFSIFGLSSSTQYFQGNFAINSQYNIIIGDSSQMDSAVNYIAIYSRILTPSQIARIYNGGIAGIQRWDPSLIGGYFITANDAFQGALTWFNVREDQWPSWSSAVNSFSAYLSDYQTFLCPMGYVMKNDYASGTNQYSYCVRSGNILLTNTSNLDLTIKSLDVRYAWTVSLKFNVLQNSGQMFLIKMSQVLSLQLDSYLNLTATIFDATGTPSQIIFNKTVSTGTWHTITAVLFQFTWHFYLDSTQLSVSPTDPMVFYNDTPASTCSLLSISQVDPNAQLALSKLAIYGIPFLKNEILEFDLLNEQVYNQFEGSLLAYYNFENSYGNTLYDLSIYSQTTTFTTLLSSSDSIIWQVDSSSSLDSQYYGIEMLSSSDSIYYSRDKSLIIQSNGPLVLSSVNIGNEHTIEMCYYAFNFSSSVQLLNISTTISIFASDNTHLIYVPQITQASTVNAAIKYGQLNTWECITAAISYNQSLLYFTNFLRVSQSDSNYFSSQSALTSTKFYKTPYQSALRYVQLARNFNGSLREVRIWNQFVNPAMGKRIYRSHQLLFHYPSIVMLYHFSEGIGSALNDTISGSQTTFPTTVFWGSLGGVTLQVCDAEHVYSEGGYCLSAEKFMKLKSDLTFTIYDRISQNIANSASQYNLLRHSTIITWVNVGILTSTASTLGNIFQINVGGRFAFYVDYSGRIYINVPNYNPYESRLNMQMSYSNFDQWNLLSVSCSDITMECKVGLDLLDSDKSQLGTTVSVQYLDQAYLNMSQVGVQIKVPVDLTKYALYLREFRIYQIPVPLISTILKLDLSLRPSLFPALVAYYKFDEFSGQVVYNSAFNLSQTGVALYETATVSWHFFKETVSQSQIQFYSPVKYMFCNKENFTYQGDHCEYYQCYSQCNNNSRLGICNGWLEGDCGWLNISDLSLQLNYTSVFNEYTECWRYCQTCIYPWLNQNCSSCISGTYAYFDRKALKIYSNQSCWSSCPIGTYPKASNMTCLNCPNYCECDASSPTTCKSCLTTLGYSLLYDSRRDICVPKCENKTYYDLVEIACIDCYSLCQSCNGSSKFDCETCISGYTLFKRKSSPVKFCVIASCPAGYYFDDWETYTCNPCDSTCKSCAGPGNFNCTRCADSFVPSPYYEGVKGFICANCFTYSTMIDTRYSSVFSDQLNFCLEVCGDGFNMNQFACDDGNKRNGDGCSSLCKVEEHWVCSGGTDLVPDKCYEQDVPVLKSTSNADTSFNVTNKTISGFIYLNFNIPIQVLTDPLKLDVDITFTVLGSNGPYNYTYSFIVTTFPNGSQGIAIQYFLHFSTVSEASLFLLIAYRDTKSTSRRAWLHLTLKELNSKANRLLAAFRRQNCRRAMSKLFPAWLPPSRILFWGSSWPILFCH